MLEDGVLTEIIQQFLQSTAIWCFDSVADMKLATNLINGSYARTLGYYSANDGGEATYKITNNISIGEYQETLTGDLYATLITEDSCNVKQFGAYGDNTHDDTTSFTNAISFIKNHNLGELIIPNGTYYITDEIEIEELNNLTINCYGTINRESSSSPKAFIYMYNCNGIKINNLNLSSTRDKTESAPAGHTRVSSLGSNIVGIFIEYSSNIKINNPIFENLATDINVNGDSSHTDRISKNIIVNNLISTNCSLPIYLAFMDNFYLNESNITPAADMGSGEHIVYMSQYTDNCYIDKCILKAPDTNYGSLIHPSQSNVADLNADPKNMYITNSYLKANKILQAINKYVSFINCEFESISSVSNIDMFVSYKNSKVLISDSIINSQTRIFSIAGTDNTTAYSNEVIINNCDITTTTTDNTFMNQNGNLQTSKMIIKNNKIKVKAYLYYNSSYTTGETIISNNEIIYDNTSATDGVLSNRSNNTITRFINNLVKCLDAQYTGVAYNPNVSTLNSYIYNNILYNMNRIYYTSQADYNVSHGNYINDTLQS